MTNKELIAELQKLPPDLEVYHLWDGSTFTKIKLVWLSKSGKKFVTSDYDEYCYNEEDRPTYAPTQQEDRYWRTPKSPNACLSCGGVIDGESQKECILCGFDLTRHQPCS